MLLFVDFVELINFVNFDLSEVLINKQSINFYLYFVFLLFSLKIVTNIYKSRIDKLDLFDR